MIKNLENKMEKMQQSINKGIEELKNKHTETNNTITEVKNTLGLNSRISEAEERISELEDKMVEITSEEQNKVKKKKLIVSETPETISNKPTFKLQESQKKKRKRKGMRKFLKQLQLKIFEATIVENFPNMEKKIVSQVQEVQSPIQDKYKEKDAKTHTNQTNRLNTKKEY